MTYVNRELADKYQDFFNFMNQEHNLILTKDEMDEILSEAERLVKKLTSVYQANLRQGCRKPKTKRKSIKTGTTTCYPFWKEVIAQFEYCRRK